MIILAVTVIYIGIAFTDPPFWPWMGCTFLYVLLLFLAWGRYLVKKAEAEAEIWEDLDDFPLDDSVRDDSHSVMKKNPVFFHPAFKDFSANIWHKD